MSHPRKWCYYDINTPHEKQNFTPDMCSAIEAAFMNSITNKVTSTSINGCMFDFQKMECYHSNRTFKVSSNGGYIPYKVQMGDVTALPDNDAQFIRGFDPSKIGHRWFWWDNPNRADPFALYKAYGTINPMWTHYSPADERALDDLYATYSKSPEQHPINAMFCVRFECTYEGKHKVMIQGRNDDESNPAMPDPAKRRRPIIKSTFCWCWDNSNGTGDPAWTPYDLNVSTLLEEAFFSGKPEIDVTLGTGNYTINFSQEIQFSTTDASKKRRIKRFGTEYVDVFTRNIAGGNAGSTNDMIPQYWLKGQTTKFLEVPNLSQNEQDFICQLFNKSNQGKNNIHTFLYHIYAIIKFVVVMYICIAFFF